MEKLKKVKVILLCLGIITITALSACKKNTDKPIDSTGVNGQSEQQLLGQQDLNIALTAQPPALDPCLTVSNIAMEIGNNIFEPLYTLNADYEPTPMLAEAVEISEDGLIYTFTLRQGIVFHNGKEMNAEDVVASMNRWLTLATRPKALLAGAVFEKVNDYEVQLILTESYSDILILLATPTQFPGIMPKEITESASATDGVSEFIGTGPYQFVEWRQDQYIQLTKFDGYQSVETPASGFSGKKEAPIQNLYFHFVPDSSTRIAGVRTGQYDVAESIPLEEYAALENDSTMKLLSRSGGSLNLYLNSNEGVFSASDYRKACLTALNNDEIMLASYGSDELYSLNAGYMNPRQSQWKTTAGENYYNQSNPEQTKILFEQAGYQGETIRILTTTDYAEMYSASVVVQEQLRQAGVTAELVVYDFPTFMETKDKLGEWDILITSNNYQLTPSQILAVTPSWIGLDDSNVTALVSKMRTAKTPEEANTVWAELQRYLYEQGYSTVIGHFMSVMAVSEHLEDVVFFEYPVLWNVDITK